MTIQQSKIKALKAMAMYRAVYMGKTFAKAAQLWGRPQIYSGMTLYYDANGQRRLLP
jgi:hypothetical protein